MDHLSDMLQVEVNIPELSIKYSTQQVVFCSDSDLKDPHGWKLKVIHTFKKMRCSLTICLRMVLPMLGMVMLSGTL